MGPPKITDIMTRLNYSSREFIAEYSAPEPQLFRVFHLNCKVKEGNIDPPPPHFVTDNSPPPTRRVHTLH